MAALRPASYTERSEAGRAVEHLEGDPFLDSRGAEDDLEGPSESFAEDVEKSDDESAIALTPKGDVEPRRPPASERHSSGYIKWVAVIVLLLQSAGTNVIMPLTRRTEWNTLSGVINQEIAKGAVSALALLWGGGCSNLASALRPTPEALKTAVPAFLFLIQNNLQYVAAGYLNPTMFAVLHQLKILTTALLSVVLLQKRISCTQWVALAILPVGAALVVLDHVKPKREQRRNEPGVLLGVVAMIAATLLSGLAGVYFEKLLKGSTVTLAARNLQLACYSAVVGLVFFTRLAAGLRLISKVTRSSSGYRYATSRSAV